MKPFANHDDQGMNVLYHNSHVEFLDKPASERVIAEIKAGLQPAPLRAAAERLTPASAFF